MNSASKDDDYAIYDAKEPILFYPNDPPELYLLISKLIDRKYYVRRPSKNHIKHRAINYYPSTGTITIDGRGRRTEKGADAFLALVENEYPKRARQNYRKRASPAKSSPPSPVLEINLDDDDCFYPATLDTASNGANGLPW